MRHIWLNVIPVMQDSDLPVACLLAVGIIWALVAGALDRRAQRQHERRAQRWRQLI